MKTQITPTTRSRAISNGSGLPLRPSPGTARSRTQFIVILDTAGKPIALAPMEQLKNTRIPADRIRIVRDQKELSEIWK